ncbi:acetyl-CoA carboxylase biotin carboxyl carrier protein [bacterium]|nr:acetyl-CoA carboxylase biotin carboxyl carrier protein [bacterium]
MDIKYVEKLAKLVDEHQLTELTVTEGESKLTLKKEPAKSGEMTQVMPPIQKIQPQIVKEEKVEEKKEERKTNKVIKSPMVGTFYKAPAAGAPPFVEVGGLVAQGEVVCIIEAMKLMNEIESDFSGKVVEICVEDGQPVEYGQTLMYIE